MNSEFEKYVKIISKLSHPILLAPEAAEVLVEMDKEVRRLHKVNDNLRELLEKAYVELNKPWWKRIF